MSAVPTRREATHERIVDAAARVLRRDGYAGVGVADVMKQAGLTHGGFYAHFGSRDALLVEITLSDLDGQRVAMRRVAPQDYLVDARALARGLAPNATATIDLEVQDPGRNAVAFEFKFR